MKSKRWKRRNRHTNPELVKAWNRAKYLSRLYKRSFVLVREGEELWLEFA